MNVNVLFFDFGLYKFYYCIGITCPFCTQPIILAWRCFAVNSYGLIGRAFIDFSNCLYTISTAADIIFCVIESKTKCIYSLDPTCHIEPFRTAFILQCLLDHNFGHSFGTALYCWLTSCIFWWDTHYRCDLVGIRIPCADLICYCKLFARSKNRYSHTTGQYNCQN